MQEMQEAYNKYALQILIGYIFNNSHQGHYYTFSRVRRVNVFK